MKIYVSNGNEWLKFEKDSLVLDALESFDLNIEFGDAFKYRGKTYSWIMSKPKDNIGFVREIKEIDPPEEIFYADEITCPYCGSKSESFEFPDEGEEDCCQCGSKYSYSRNIEVSYSTCPVEKREIEAVKP